MLFVGIANFPSHFHLAIQSMGFENKLKFFNHSISIGIFFLKQFFDNFIFSIQNLTLFKKKFEFLNLPRFKKFTSES